MKLVKFADYIQTAADKAFLAHCTCKGDTCHCSYDGHHLKSIHSKGNKPQMPTVLDSLSAADRKRLADQILSLPHDQQRELVAQLGSIVDMSAKAEEAANKKKAFISKLSAMKADKNIGAGNAIGLIEGDLSRAHCPPLAELGLKPQHEINQILAASNLSINSRMAVKNLLGRLGAI